MAKTTNRLRNPPQTRFRGEERFFDLDTAFEALPDQSTGRAGHMQKTLYRYGPTTTAIFAFQEDAGLEEYRVEAEAIIHIIRGKIRVATPTDTYDLSDNQVLLLDPHVPQSIRALEPSRVLMTIVSDDEDTK